MFLSAMGTIAMILGTISYWAMLRDLHPVGRFRVGRPGLWIAIVTSIAGARLFCRIALRLIWQGNRSGWQRQRRHRALDLADLLAVLEPA